MLCLSFNIFLVCYLAVMILTCSLTICKHMNLNSLLLKLPTFENVPTSLRNCIDILYIFEKINKLIDCIFFHIFQLILIKLCLHNISLEKIELQVLLLPKLVSCFGSVSSGRNELKLSLRSCIKTYILWND